MSLDDRPDSVQDEAKTIHVGHNCVACVAAVLHNELTPTNLFATANMVARRYNIAPKFNLDPDRAVQIIKDFAKIKTSDGNPEPWQTSSPDGHYAVFCFGRRHVFYGYREKGGYYLWDPQLEHDWTLPELAEQVYPPYQCFHFKR